MSKIRAAITSVGGYVPEYRLTNKVLETMVDTNDEWITSRTGIKERRILKGEGLGTSDMAVEAVNELLKKRGISADEIDLLICSRSDIRQHFSLLVLALVSMHQVHGAKLHLIFLLGGIVFLWQH